MPDLNQATTTKTTKRGYRKISMTLKLAEYEVIAKMAEIEDRTPDQQALHMLRRLVSELHVEAIRSAVQKAEARRAYEHVEETEESREEWDKEVRLKHDPTLDGDLVLDDSTSGRDPHGIELGSVSRTE